MKMGTALFWGLLLILIGIGIVIRVVFNINIPVVKFVIAFFLIFMGIKLLIGNTKIWRGHVDEDTTIFGERKYDGMDERYKEYNVVFGSSIIDLRDIDLTEGSKDIKINTVFGNTVLKISSGMPVKIKADAVFSSAKLPNGNTASFGTGRYESESYSKDKNHVYITGDVVFGNLEVKVY